MKIFEVVSKVTLNGEYSEGLYLVPGKDWADAARVISRYYGEDLIGYSIRELETPVLLDSDKCLYWKEKSFNLNNVKKGIK